MNRRTAVVGSAKCALVARGAGCEEGREFTPSVSDVSAAGTRYGRTCPSRVTVFSLDQARAAVPGTELAALWHWVDQRRDAWGGGLAVDLDPEHENGSAVRRELQRIMDLHQLVRKRFERIVAAQVMR